MRFWRAVLHPLAVCLSLWCANPVVAQTLASGIDEEAGAESPPSDASEAPDLYARQTPRSTVTALLGAISAEEATYIDAYFDIEELSAEETAYFKLALQSALDTGGNLYPFQELSTLETGALSDGLDPSLEEVGTLAGGETRFLLVRTEDGQGRLVWKVSRETLLNLPTVIEQQTEEPVSSEAAVAMAEEQESVLRIAGVSPREWALLFFYLAVTLGSVGAGAWIILWALRQIFAREHVIYRFFNAGLPPLALLIGISLFRIGSETAEISIVGRQLILRYLGVVAPVALAWFLLRLIDGVTGWLTGRMEVRRRLQSASLVSLSRRVLKVSVFIIAALLILDTFGLDVNNWLAALGIGGLALALGAQKTVENLVGTVTVLLDRPIQVGDFCKVGDVLGTVEDIGIRSTRIRTLARTLVTIPNGDFSSRQIENYSSRDQIFLNETINLEYSLSSDQLTGAINAVEELLLGHEAVAEDPCYVTLHRFGPATLQLSIFAYLLTNDYFEALAVKQTVLLAIYKELERIGVPIALPTQTLYLHEAKPELGSAAFGSA
ncbi:MAG: mechanosensitive ion channel family protein [Pseudomonadota bacterium]